MASPSGIASGVATASGGSAFGLALAASLRRVEDLDAVGPADVDEGDGNAVAALVDDRRRGQFAHDAQARALLDIACHPVDQAAGRTAMNADPVLVGVLLTIAGRLVLPVALPTMERDRHPGRDRKSTRLNSSH